MRNLNQSMRNSENSLAGFLKMKKNNLKTNLSTLLEQKITFQWALQISDSATAMKTRFPKTCSTQESSMWPTNLQSLHPTSSQSAIINWTCLTWIQALIFWTSQNLPSSIFLKPVKPGKIKSQLSSNSKNLSAFNQMLQTSPKSKAKSQRKKSKKCLKTTPKASSALTSQALRHPNQFSTAKTIKSTLRSKKKLTSATLELSLSLAAS